MRRIAGLVAALATVCLALGVLLPGAAGADSNGKVLLSVGGAAFSATPSGAVFDVIDLAPGGQRSADLGVRSAFGVGTKMSVQLVDPHDDDNGCTHAEAVVDRTCGAGEGELRATLAASVDLANSPTGHHRTVWTGRLADLEHAVALDAGMPARGERWLRITVTLPGSVGNVVQTDTLTFGIRVVLSGAGTQGGSAIAGEHTNGGGGHETSSLGIAGLAATGVSVVLLVVGALALIVAGVMFAMAGLAGRRGDRG